jgi:hypothetical protein
MNLDFSAVCECVCVCEREREKIRGGAIFLDSDFEHGKVELECQSSSGGNAVLFLFRPSIFYNIVPVLFFVIQFITISHDRQE